MDKRTLLAVALALAAYYVWMMWVGTNPVPIDTDIDQVEPGPDVATTVEPTAVPVPEPMVPAVSLPTPAELPHREGLLRACGTEVGWTSDGGVLRGIRLDDYEALYEVTPLWKWVYLKATKGAGPWKPYGESPGRAVVATDQAAVLAVSSGALDAASPSVEVVEHSDSRVVLRGVTADGIEVTRSISFDSSDDCMADVEVSWRNLGTAPYAGDLWVGVHDVLPEKTSRYSAASRPVAYYGDKFETFNKTHKLEAPEHREGAVSYFGLADGYFAAVLLAEPGNQGSVVFTKQQRGESPAYGTQFVLHGGLGVGEVHSEQFQLFIGPKVLSDLKEIRPELGKLVALGIFGLFARMLLVALNFFHDLVGNWGLAIICLTLLVKGLFFPLTQMSFKSSQAMQSLQPQLKKLREELKDNPEELNKQTMALFKKNGVNPLGGCLPMLIQMPVWFALYRVLLSSVDLYHTDFLYLQDLSATDPYIVLPTVVVILMLVQQRFTPTGNMDPTQARMMKMMPLVFGFFFFTFPSGLVLYIFVNMVLTILQQWWIRRRYGTPATASD